MASASMVWLSLVCCCWRVMVVNAFSGGALMNVCHSMTPGHRRSAPQTTTPPYNITSDVACYTPHHPLTLTLSGFGDVTFMGFFIQARRQQDEMTSHGIFDILGNINLGTLDCFTKQNSAAAHVNSNLKSHVTFTWTPPSDFTDDIHFIATVVQEYKVYWIKSVRAMVSRCSVQTTINVQTATTSTHVTRNTDSTGKERTATTSRPSISDMMSWPPGQTSCTKEMSKNCDDDDDDNPSHSASDNDRITGVEDEVAASAARCSTHHQVVMRSVLNVIVALFVTIL